MTRIASNPPRAGRRRAARWVCAGVGLLFAGALAAAETGVAPNVSAVVEGGHWSEPGIGEGRYRVVVVTGGFEHVSSRVVADWKADGDESGNATIAHTVELVAPDAYSLGAPTIAVTKDGVRVDIAGAATYAPDKQVTCRFDLAPGGETTIVRACGD